MTIPPVEIPAHQPFAEARLFDPDIAVERVVDGRRPPEEFGPLDAA